MIMLKHPGNQSYNTKAAQETDKKPVDIDDVIFTSVMYLHETIIFMNITIRAQLFKICIMFVCKE
jgi:hypothetical protein